jgi:predicted TIM-barrel fold metal-dependent hydrolase
MRLSDNLPLSSPPGTRKRRSYRRLFWSVPILIGAALAARLLFFSGPYRTPTADPDVASIIDIHCHTAGIGAGESGCFISKALRDSYKFGIYLKAFGTTRSELEARGDAYLVDRIAGHLSANGSVAKAVVLAMDGAVDDRGELDMQRTEIYVPNEFVARETARHTNLLFGASINPLRHDSLARLDACVSNGAVLVKWIPSIMHFDPSDERITPFYRRMVVHGIPLLCHAGQERSFTGARDEFCDPERLRLPLKLGVTVIAAHIASTGENSGERDTDRLRKVMAEFPNLYSEISSLTQANKLGYLREALADPVFEGRLCYGSDFPLINTALVSPWFYPLNLTREQMSEIAGIENPWDADIALKRALGVPPDIFTRTAALLRQPPVRPAIP